MSGAPLSHSASLPATVGADTLADVWRAQGVRAEDLRPDASGTLGRPTADVTLTVAAAPDVELASLGNAEEGGVVLGEVIGTGGMGVVRAGTQVTLGREVAVKQVHAEPAPGRPGRLAAFLREAWVSASLEHPNIVPVHALCSERGEPVLLMKRVEGVAWRSLLDDPALASTYGLDPRDPLAFHLGVFLRVCHALHFAHTRGVVHLDLKPDNVMVGRHGEVYLVDWGLSASFDADAPRYMARTSDIGSVVGTPGYLAPEQAAGLGVLFGPVTDVFLLGALLHRVVTGAVPYRADTLVAALEAAFVCEPMVYDDDVPLELVSILRRAMARSGEERFQTADDMRVAVEHFVEHRDVNTLLDEAARRLRWLVADLSAPPAERRSAASVRRLENECRFGLEEALARWPGNARALAALTELTRTSVSRALREGDWRAAGAALGRLPEPDRELAARVEQARAAALEAAKERALLEDLGSHQDILRHAELRSKVAAFVAVGWSLWFLGVGWLLRAGHVEVTHAHLLLNALVSGLIYAGVMWRVRGTLMATQIDRRALLLLAVSFAGAGLLWLLSALLAVPPLHAIALSSGVYVFFFVSTSIVVDRRLGWLTLALAPFALLAFLDVAHVLEWQGAYVLVGGLALSLTWRRDAQLARAREAAAGR